MDEQETIRRRVIQDVLKLECSDCDLTEEAVRQSDRELYDRACSVFGTWEAALDYAAVRKSRRNRPDNSPQQVIKKVRRRCGCLNSMRARFVRKSDHRLYRQGVELFGTWKNAVKAAGINVDKLYPGKTYPVLNEEQAVAALRHRIVKGGIPTLTVLACENQYLARFLIRRFERFSAAIDAATSKMPEGDHEHSNTEINEEPPESKNVR